MMREKRHDKIVQLNQKKSHGKEIAGAKNFLYPEIMTKRVEPCFPYDPFIRPVK